MRQVNPETLSQNYVLLQTNSLSIMIEPIALHLVDHILFVLLGIILPLRTISSQKKLKDITFHTRIRISLYIGNSIGLWLMALPVLATWWWFSRPYSTLGLVWTEQALSIWSIGFVVLFFLLYLVDAYQDVFTEKGREQTKRRLSKELSILPRKWKAYLYFIPLAFSAGICEEIVFRGFFLTYLVSLLGNQIGGQIAAVIISAIIFGFVHTYQGKQAIIKIIAMALLFGLVYLWSGSIYVLIILHALVDLIGGAVGLLFPEPSAPEIDYADFQGPPWEEE